jgi:hypothetical protein
MDELRVLENFINCMTKVYRQRNVNWAVVRDILMQGTSTSGRTSCTAKCIELGIDPWGYTLKGEAKADDID